MGRREAGVERQRPWMSQWGEERPRLAKTRIRVGKARVNRPRREQIEWTQVDCGDAEIPEDHDGSSHLRATLDRIGSVSLLRERIKSVGGGPGNGRPRMSVPGVAGVVDAGHRGWPE